MHRLEFKKLYCGGNWSVELTTYQEVLGLIPAPSKKFFERIWRVVSTRLEKMEY